MKRAWLALLAAGAMTLSAGARQAAGTADDDARVFKAVLDATVRPELIRLSPDIKLGSPAPVIVFDRTVALCRPDPPPFRDPGCVSDEYLERLEGSMPRERPAFSFLDIVVRRALGRSFRISNASTVPFPAAKIEGVIPVVPELRADVLNREKGRTRGFAAFSQPGYAADGLAVVHARYICGGLCGYGWLVLLERRGAEWHVVSAELVVIS